VTLLYELLRASSINPIDYISYTYYKSVWRSWIKLFHILTERLLRKIDALLAVSSSIPIEMDSKWAGRVIALKPGVGFEESEIETLLGFRSSRVVKVETTLYYQLGYSH